jgi:hypothetical protein
MGTEIQIPSYIWKETIEFKYKKELCDRIILDYINYSKSDEFKFKFNTKITSCFMKQFYDEDIPVFCDKDQIFINELSSLIKKAFCNYLKYYHIDDSFFIFKMWYSLYENEMETLSHSHDADFSGVYYLKFNKETDNKTFFENTNFTKPPKKEIIFEPDLDENDLLFFPSGYMHGSKKHIGNDYRIIIAFDIFCDNFSSLADDLQKKPISKIVYQ